jgi:hypothetical protein
VKGRASRVWSGFVPSEAAFALLTDHVGTGPKVMDFLNGSKAEQTENERVRQEG